MKNKFFTLLLTCVFVFTLTANTFADGEIPIGGRTCQQLNNCPVASEPGNQEEENTIIKTVLDYLSELFG